MKRTTRQSSFAAAALAATAAVPAGNALAASHATPTPTPTRKTSASKHMVKGPLVDMRWGPVRVSIIVQKKKIKDVKTVTNPDTRRSSIIDDDAVPQLRQEVLDAQNADIDLVSGATMTSGAFVQSLKGAIKKAHKKKEL